jgi:lipoprotein signal peptidase
MAPVAVFVAVFVLDRLLKRRVSRRTRGRGQHLVGGISLCHTRHICHQRLRSWIRLATLVTCAIGVALAAPPHAANAYAAAFAGAASNGVDQRAATGVVNTFMFVDRVAFNLADVAIVVGVCTGLLVMLA